jgi:hypothetical protein
MIGRAMTTDNALKRITLALAVAALMAAMLVTSTNSANAKNTMPVNPGQQGNGSYDPPHASGAFKGEGGGSEVLHSPSGDPACMTHFGGKASGKNGGGC